MAGGGVLSRLAIARLQSAGVPVVPLLKRVGLPPEVIADPQERLSVRSQVALHISKIAWLLGFNEVSAFTHRFKRWTGKAPSQMRATAASSDFVQGG